MNLSSSVIMPSGVRTQRGAIFVELAVALPILVLLFLVSTEYVRALQVQQTLAVVSREAANAAFRDCIELDDMEQCLDIVYNDVWNSAKQALPGMELMISVYIYHKDTDTVTRDGIRGGPTTASGKASRFSAATYNGPNKSFLMEHQKIAVAETFFDFSPIMKNAPISTSFYDAAIY